WEATGTPAEQAREPRRLTVRCRTFAPEGLAAASPGRAEARPSAGISQDKHALESVGRERLRRAAPPCLAQKTREIFLFPTSGTFIEAKFAFAEIEFVGVHTAPPIIAHLVRHDRMQHFMIQDVLEEPKRNEELIEPGIDTNDAIFFLNGPE